MLIRVIFVILGKYCKDLKLEVVLCDFFILIINVFD